MKWIAQIAFLACLGLSVSASAQCRGFAKKKCRPSLEAYTHDGKMNIAQLFPGDKAEIQLTFYQGQSYRLLICADKTFKGVDFSVYDTDKSLVFDSQKSDTDYFDFKVAATQQLIVEIKIPQEGNESVNDMEITGCVAVMVGLK